MLRGLGFDVQIEQEEAAGFFHCRLPYIFLSIRYCSRIRASNGICRGFAFQYGKFLLPPRFLTALSVPKVPTREPVTSISLFSIFSQIFH
ncbi:MAG: hypothetical protein ACLR3S_01730 [Clostridium fessum]